MRQSAKGILVTIAVVFIYLMLFIVPMLVIGYIISDDDYYDENMPIEFDSDFPTNENNQFFKNENNALTFTLNDATYILLK